MGGAQQFTKPVCDEPAFVVFDNPTHRFDGRAVYGHFRGVNCQVRAKPHATRRFTGNFNTTNNEFHMTLVSAKATSVI